MTGQGRPLRFLAGVLALWTMARAWALWPVAIPIHLAGRAQAATAPQNSAGEAAATSPPTSARSARIAPERLAGPSPDQRPVARGSTAPVRATAPASADPAPMNRLAAVSPDRTPLLPGTSPVPSERTRSRWSGSAWALLRGGTGTVGAAPVSQLGGAQAGFRISYALDAARRIALTARVSAPLQGPGREAGLGVAWRPTRLPVTIIAEQRVSLDGERGGPALFAIAGINPTPVAAGFRVEAYGEAGAVKRDRLDTFADGAARLTRPVGKGPFHLDLGVGAWGGAQTGATRVDIGPTLGASLPVARHSLRLTLDWRERVAGGAKPGSGPALTVGTDF